MMKRLMVISGLVILGLLLAGCGLIGGGGNSPPAIRLVVDGEAVDGIAGSYCWGGLCADMMDPEFTGSVTLPAGESLQFELERPYPDTVFLDLSPDLFGEAAASESLDGAASLDWPAEVEPGTYILSIGAKWADGDASYFYSVTFE